MWQGGREGRRQQNQSGGWLPLLKFQSLPSTHQLTEGTAGANLPPPAPASVRTEEKKKQNTDYSPPARNHTKKEEPF